MIGYLLHVAVFLFLFFFFFNDTATTEIYTLSLHDALPIRLAGIKHLNRLEQVLARNEWSDPDVAEGLMLDNNRSEEHTSELQSLRHLVCRLLLEKKKQPW